MTFQGRAVKLQVGSHFLKPYSQHDEMMGWIPRFPTNALMVSTLTKTDIAPENKPSQKERIVFQPSFLLGGYVSFPAGIPFRVVENLNFHFTVENACSETIWHLFYLILSTSQTRWIYGLWASFSSSLCAVSGHSEW